LLLISIALLLPYYRVARSCQVEDDEIAAFTVRRRQRVRAAKLQIGSDRESGERRSARLKCRTLRRDKDASEMGEMLDRSGRERHRQERCIWQE
jgi:hypothetical protein